MFGFGKGKMEIKLNNYNFSEGDTIEGTLSFTLKKPQHSKEASIQLYAEQQTTQFANGRTTNNTVTVFDFKQPLDGEKDYAPGTQVEYPFQIKIPAGATAQQAPDGMLGQVAKAANFMSNRRTSVRWYLTGRIAIKGFDLTKKVQINVA